MPAFPCLYNTVFDHSIIEEWCAARPGEPAGPAGLRDAAAIRKKLADEGITHVYVNWLEILRYRSPGNYGYTDFVTPELFAELQRLGILGPAVGHRTPRCPSSISTNRGAKKPKPGARPSSRARPTARRSPPFRSFRCCRGRPRARRRGRGALLGVGNASRWLTRAGFFARVKR